MADKERKWLDLDLSDWLQISEFTEEVLEKVRIMDFKKLQKDNPELFGIIMNWLKTQIDKTNQYLKWVGKTYEEHLKSFWGRNIECVILQTYWKMNWVYSAPIDWIYGKNTAVIIDFLEHPDKFKKPEEIEKMIVNDVAQINDAAEQWLVQPVLWKRIKLQWYEMTWDEYAKYWVINPPKETESRVEFQDIEELLAQIKDNLISLEKQINQVPDISIDILWEPIRAEFLNNITTYVDQLVLAWDNINTDTADLVIDFTPLDKLKNDLYLTFEAQWVLNKYPEIEQIMEQLKILWKNIVILSLEYDEFRAVLKSEIQEKWDENVSWPIWVKKVILQMYRTAILSMKSRVENFKK